MTTAITVSPVMDVARHKDAINAIQRVLSEVMIDGKHYGKIPGCGDKPCLLKPGAEKIMATFGIRPEVEITKSVDPIDGHYTYEVTVRALSHDGAFLGEGVGECSTREEKYAWEKAASDEHFAETPESDRRLRWRRGKNPWQEQQVRTNPADKANTVLKMAKKRALVDMVLTVTAASDIFEQDLDEEHLRPAEMDAPPEPVKPPQRKSESKPKSEPKKSSAAPNPTVVGTIKKVTEKDGSGPKGPYTKYGVLLDNGEWYNTFDTEVGGFASDRQGSEVEIIYKDNSYGHQIQSIGDPATAPQNDELGPPAEGEVPF